MEIIGVGEIYKVLDLVDRAEVCKRPQGNQGGKSKVQYLNLVTAFDIETTRLPDIEQSVMYIWQWAFGSDLVLIGRTWEEFLQVCTQISAFLPERLKLPVYVHNLSYEFQFLAGIYHFKPEDVFALKSRKVLKATMEDYRIEFRCSYIHSNMTLAAYTHAMGVEHAKLSDFDYGVIRYPWTPLTKDELAYCVHDVVGLVEALQVELDREHDTLYSIPATSTGYVRRDAKRAMKSFRPTVQRILPEYHLFELLRLAFRGGDTHANRWYSGDIVNDVHSFDRSSSYPDVICNCKYPMSEFKQYGSVSIAYMEELRQSGKAIVMRVAITNISLRHDHVSMPYLPYSKCECCTQDVLLDNGRVLSAGYLETVLTDIDLVILARDYDLDGKMVILDLWAARYGYLPSAFRDLNIEYYRRKTILKGDPEQEYYYNRAKNKLNSCYGMTAQNPCGASITYREGEGINGGFVEEEVGEEYYNAHMRGMWLSYAWAVWVTAWARFRLREGVWLVEDTPGADMIYVDTDSVKYIGDVDWTAYNRKRQQDSLRSGAYADDSKGKRHYMGVYEQEGDCARFRTWGAKKYAYEDSNGGLHLTTAGVVKRAGAEELAQRGGLEAFAPGFVFSVAGGNEIVYNDEIDEIINIDGHALHITRNAVIRPSTYRLSITSEYESILSYRTIFGEELPF